MSSGNQHSARLYPLIAAHYITSAFCFLILSVMMLFAAADFSGHYFSPKLLAITHVAALGWGTLVIFGAAWQLIPVIFETELDSQKLPWLIFLFFTSGLALLAFSFWVFDPGIFMQTGALLLLISIALFTLVIFRTSARSGRPNTIQQDFILTSCIWLTATATVGILLVFNFRYPFLPESHLHFLKLHAHMGVAGWFLLLITGISSKLIPMFLVSRKQKKGLLTWAYYLINGSLILFLTDTYISGITARTFIPATGMLAGIVVYLVYVTICFRSRIKKHIDLPVANTIISFILLLAALAVLPAIIYYHLKGSPLAIRYTTLYGSLLFIGWVSSLILGQAFKTFPFITWVRRYEHLAGKQKTPLPADLFSQNLLQAQTAAFVLFCVLFFAGVISSSASLLYGGIISLLITALTYTINLLHILVHKTKNLPS